MNSLPPSNGCQNGLPLARRKWWWFPGDTQEYTITAAELAKPTFTCTRFKTITREAFLLRHKFNWTFSLKIGLSSASWLHIDRYNGQSLEFRWFDGQTEMSLASVGCWSIAPDRCIGCSWEYAPNYNGIISSATEHYFGMWIWFYTMQEQSTGPFYLLQTGSEETQCNWVILHDLCSIFFILSQASVIGAG